MDIDFLRISTETKILKAATRANSVLVAEVMCHRLCARKCDHVHKLLIAI